MASKKQIVNSIAKFIINDLIPDIDDKQLKFLLCIARKSMKENPNMLDSFLHNSMISSAIVESDGDYDIETFASTLKEVLGDSYYPLIIPKVPLLSANDKILRITAEDVDKIIMYLQQGNSAESTSSL